MQTGPKADKPAASRVTKIEGKKLHYLTAGQGPALILLHGYTQTSRMWRPLIDKLKHKFQDGVVIAVRQNHVPDGPNSTGQLTDPL